MTCDQCRLVKYARVLPYHCECGQLHWAGAEPPPPRTREKPPRTFGRVLRDLAGCGCALSWRKWDRRGLEWCRDNAEQIVRRLTAQPKPGLSIDRARELVRLAIEIAERAASPAE